MQGKPIHTVYSKAREFTYLEDREKLFCCARDEALIFIRARQTELLDSLNKVLQSE
jgi:hypothetical protein